jgi:hypothetical protein
MPSCPSSGAIVYVLDRNGVVHSFDPTAAAPTPPFATVGSLRCQLSNGDPWTGAGNMTIDRAGTAWVTDTAGHLFKASTLDASCEPTAYGASQDGFTKVGMTFVGQNDGTERLYVVDNVNGPLSTAGQGLAVIDTTTLLLSPIGNFDGRFQGRVAELAGTSEGRLFGFFPGVDSWVAEIRPSSAHIVSSSPVPISLTGSGPTHIEVGAALVGDAFYLFVGDSAVAPFSDVHEFDLSTATSRIAFSQIGFNIVGAAVANCPPAISSDGG